MFLLGQKQTPCLPNLSEIYSKNGTGSDESVLSTYSAGYQFNPVLTANKTNRDRVYSQRVEGLPVIADSGIMTFQYNKSGKPVGFTKRQLVNIERLRDDRATITEEEAIISLYRYNEIDSGDSLSKGYLSYDRTLTVNGYDIFYQYGHLKHIVVMKNTF